MPPMAVKLSGFPQSLLTLWIRLPQAIPSPGFSCGARWTAGPWRSASAWLPPQAPLRSPAAAPPHPFPATRRLLRSMNGLSANPDWPPQPGISVHPPTKALAAPWGSQGFSLSQQITARENAGTNSSPSLPSLKRGSPQDAAQWRAAVYRL